MLSAARDSFIGRERDLQLVGQRLSEARQVTLVGPPGIGKTRAAMEIGRRLAAEYEHVAFVPLGSARTLGAALAAVGAALELELPPLAESDLPQAIASEISRFGRTLLILDNFEQLVDSATILVERIFELAPDVHLLVTSRARLRLTGESVVELRGLSSEEDMQLLIDRVKRLRAEYEPGETELLQLRAVADRLEGVPLALEVAAARISTLGAANVAARLELTLQDNLRRAIARSWDLLTSAEREVLAACSVFRGGFDLDAATAVFPAALSLFDDLSELCEKSLLASAGGGDGGRRFHLFESIREFAADQLSDPLELNRRHAEHYVAVGERMQAGAEGRDAQEILDALTREHDNLLAAADRGLCEQVGVSRDLGMRALLALAPLALARGPIAPLVEKLDEVLEEASDLEPRLRIAAHLAAGRGHRRLHRTEPSRKHHATAIALATEIRDDALMAKVTSDAAMTLLSEGELESSLAMLSEAVNNRERAADHSGAALDRLRMGMALRELGRLDQAQSLLEEAMDVFRREGNAFRSGLAFAELVHVALERGQFEEAHQLLSRARRSGAQAASRLTDAALTARAAMLSHAEGDLAAAETSLSAAIIGLRRIGYRRFEAGSVGYLGVVDFEQGRLELARERMQVALDMTREPRIIDIMSGWLCVIDVARGDRTAARRAADRIGPLRPGDPLSAASHVLMSSLTGALPVIPTMPSHDVRLASRVLDKTGERPIVVRPDALRVASSGRWFVLPGGVRGECNRYRALGLILLELVKQRLLRPGQAVSRETLIAAGWPGEKIHAEAARNRIKSAIASLRRSGLEQIVQHSPAGYSLDSAIPIVVAGED